MKRVSTLLIAGAASLWCGAVAADMADKLSRLEDYTIIKVGTITGWQSQDGKRGDSFEGCDYGRKLFIDDSLQVTCTDYFYEYAYRPTVIFLMRNNRLKMIVGNDVHDVER